MRSGQALASPPAGRLRRVAAAYAGVVRSRAYFPLWLGQLVSGFGDTLHYIALVVLVFQLTGRGLGVAGLVAAEVLPVLLLVQSLASFAVGATGALVILSERHLGLPPPGSGPTPGPATAR